MKRISPSQWTPIVCGVLLASATAVACSAQSPTASDKPTPAPDGGTAAVDASDEGSSCVTLGYHADPFSVGMKKEGTAGSFSFVLSAADPAPPDDPTMNTWTVQVLDPTGKPVTDALISLPVNNVALGWPNVKNPWMPTMHHGSSIETTVTNNGDGTAKLQIYFSMSGLWQTFVVAQSGSVTDSATFAFCLP
jgi:hypothetical protein